MATQFSPWWMTTEPQSLEEAKKMLDAAREWTRRVTEAAHAPLPKHE